MGRTMKINDVKVSAKLYFGFGTIVVLAVLIGFIGWNGLNKVSFSVVKADDANRIVKNALEARQIEKNFALRKDAQYIDQANKLKDSVSELFTELTGKLKIEAHRQQVADMQDAFNTWHAAFIQYTELEAEKEKANSKMVSSARNATDECTAMRADQKAKLESELNRNAGAAAIKSRLAKADDANRLIKMIGDARRHEKNYIIRADSKYEEQNSAVLDQMYTLLEDLKDRFRDAINDRQADNVIAAVDNYSNAFEQYTELIQQQGVQEEQMVKQARQMVELANSLRQDQKQQSVDAQSAAVNMILIISVVALILGVGLSLLITKMLTGGTDLIKASAERLAEGDINLGGIDQAKLNDLLEGKDELGDMGRAMMRMIESLKDMNREVLDLTDSALKGELDDRADVSLHKGSYAEMVNGLNQLMEAILTPINETSEVLEATAAKNLTKRVSGKYQGKFADLKSNVNETINALDLALTQVAESVSKVSASVNQVNSASEQVTSASNQIAVGSQNLAEGTSEQASSLEEISSSLEEMASMTRQNSDNAEQARALSGTARQSAEKGNGAMIRMSEAINKIKTSSDETAKIVKTIDEIAFQTNLLALNAAVEAARAGEAGKGFAVVAEEVRNLAQRSAVAAKDTANMIDEAVNNAEEGVLINEEVAVTLKEISENNSKVSDLVAEISCAAKEQAQGVDQINTAVSQLDSVTQSNASNSEESASAAEELNGQAENLKAEADDLNNQSEELLRMISEFSLSTAGSVKPARSKTAAKPTGTKSSKAGNKQLSGRASVIKALDDNELDSAVADSSPADGNGNILSEDDFDF